ncbi:hypothetical protein J3R30DRAFT_768835, partial [Lentinula aciculospora]
RITLPNVSHGAFIPRIRFFFSSPPVTAINAPIMFGFIRRISNSVLPRPDRPWDDDATSNAPKIGRKRRLSSTERDLVEDKKEQSRSKKHRGDTPQTPLELSTAANLEEAGPSTEVDSEGVKEVTKGVKEVELEEKKAQEHNDEAEVVTTDESGSNEETVVDPELVPLPKELSGELDDTSSIASTPPADPVDEETTETLKETARTSEITALEVKERSDDADEGTTSETAEPAAKFLNTEESKEATA